MRERRTDLERHRAQEFEDFAAGAGALLLRTAGLLAGDGAEALLTSALARTYAEWDGLRGDDPYDRARRILAVRFSYGAWHRHLPRHRPHGGPLDGLSTRQRLVLVLWLHEGLAPEQTAAVLGMTEERVRAVCARAVDAMRTGVRSPAAGPGTYG
ncbi:MAG TPA: sigma factor-like helix-turn-helix DNA-binding protein, partial [Streptomyces sp.]